MNKHYQLWENTQAIDIIKASMTKKEYKGFLKGNILKYRLRAGKKDCLISDMQKARNYEILLELAENE
jgi:hypothetical protein